MNLFVYLITKYVDKSKNHNIIVTEGSYYSKGEIFMDHTIELLTRFGLTASEAKVYVSLLQMDASTGYKISGKSGVARSKVYNILSSLVERGFVFKSKDQRPLYSALPVDELTIKLNSERKKDIKTINNDLSKIGPEQDSGSMWSINDYDQAFEKILFQINSAKKSLYVQIYSEDLSDEIVKALSDAEQRLHDFVVILFSDHHRYTLPFRRFYKHYFEADKISDYGGRWINVVSDSQEVVYGKLPNNAKNVDLIWTKNNSMVFMAKEYVLHDAYNLRTLNSLNKEAHQVFGPNLEGVRNIYFDK